MSQVGPVDWHLLAQGPLGPTGLLGPTAGLSNALGFMWYNQFFNSPLHFEPYLLPRCEYHYFCLLLCIILNFEVLCRLLVLKGEIVARYKTIL